MTFSQSHSVQDELRASDLHRLEHRDPARVEAPAETEDGSENEDTVKKMTNLRSRKTQLIVSRLELCQEDSIG
jgi:hypothetical protein